MKFLSARSHTAIGDVPDIEASLRFIEIDAAETHLKMGNPIYYFESTDDATDTPPRLIKESPGGKKEIVETDSSGSIKSLMAI